MEQVATGRFDMAEPVGGGIIRRFSAAPLHWRFALVGGLVSIMGMIVIGIWVSARIESSVVRNSAISAAVYMESFIAPLSQDLENADSLPEASRARLSKVLSQAPVSDRILSVKIWKKGGFVAYASDPALIGQRFEPTSSLRDAWKGKLIASFDDLDHAESEGERRSGMPLLEVYNPIHSIVTGEIIAIAEFYQSAAELEQDLVVAQLTSWAVVGGIAGLTFLALFGIVRAGGLTIDRQHSELRRRLNEITRISEQNERLRARIQGASERSATINEQLLRRIGVELHDGPAQALALANLRISALRKAAGAADGEVEMIHQSLEEALNDIRALARGLVLPELKGLSVRDVVQLAVDAHERRTQTEVELNEAAHEQQRAQQARSTPAESGGDVATGLSRLICIYRFVQEGLMNAFRHAEGKGQEVRWTLTDGILELTVSDKGGGFDPAAATVSDRIGLTGLRERVQSVGGEFRLDSAIGVGTTLTMRLALGGKA